MRPPPLLLSLLAALGLALLAPAQASDPRPLVDLVERLGSDVYSEREAAAERLEQYGEVAREALRRAAQGDDPEIRRRAEELLDRLQRRAEAERVLQPRKVHLVFQDAALPDALAEFNK